MRLEAIEDDVLTGVDALKRAKERERKRRSELKYRPKRLARMKAKRKEQAFIAAQDAWDFHDPLRPLVLIYTRPDLYRLKTIDVLQFVAAAFGCTLAELRSGGKVNDVLSARKIYYWLARGLTSASLPQIGRACGGRDHSTVSSGIRSIARAVEVRSEIGREAVELREQLIYSLKEQHKIVVWEDDRMPRSARGKKETDSEHIAAVLSVTGAVENLPTFPLGAAAYAHLTVEMSEPDRCPHTNPALTANALTGGA